MSDNILFKSLNIPIFDDLNSFSDKIGISRRLIYLMIKKNEMFYDTYTIEKQNGEEREINEPNFALKLVQKWILKNILERIKVSEEAMAYRADGFGGIKYNADRHKYSLYLLEMDLKNFFGTITKGMVLKLFMGMGFNKKAAWILTDLCIHKGVLPQGGVTSPYLSNLVCLKLDKRLSNICSKRNIIYTRYADDLTFSCDNREDLFKCKKIIKEIIEDELLEVNERKTRFILLSSKRKVTGITITQDNKLKAKKGYKKKVRAMIHRAILLGEYSEVDKIRGYMAYIQSIEGKEAYNDKIKRYINKLIKNKSVYQFKEVVEKYNIHKDLLLKGLDKAEFKLEIDIEYDDYGRTEVEVISSEEFEERLDKKIIKEFKSDIYKPRYEFLKERKLEDTSEEFNEVKDTVIKLIEKEEIDFWDEVPF